jgi:hypothetical protein
MKRQCVYLPLGQTMLTITIVLPIHCHLYIVIQILPLQLRGVLHLIQLDLH